MDIVELMQTAKARLQSNEQPLFVEQTATIVGLLRATGILAHSRTSIVGHTHQEFAGALVLAASTSGRFDLYSRRQGDLHTRGSSTRVVAWLDDMVSTGLLQQKQGLQYAKGEMSVGDLLCHYVAYAALGQRTPVERVNLANTI